MDENTGSPGICRKCGKVVNNDEPYCTQCQVELAEENIADVEEDTIEAGPPEEKKGRRALLLVILLILIGTIIYQAPSFFAAFKEKQPIRQGTYDTDAQTDLCITNLWRISRMLEEGTLPDNNMVCPESGMTYIVTKDSKDIVVRCPNPGKHGLSELRVSKRYPCPEVKK